MSWRRRSVLALCGAAAGALYGYGLMTAALAALLGAGGVSFFLLAATSPLFFGFASWPVVGIVLSWRDQRWCRIAVGGWLTLHLAWLVTAVVLDRTALDGLLRVLRVLPLETSGALLFWAGGQAVAWWLVANGHDGERGRTR